jgi:hypothetical protein
MCIEYFFCISLYVLQLQSIVVIFGNFTEDQH